MFRIDKGITFKRSDRSHRKQEKQALHNTIRTMIQGDSVFISNNIIASSTFKHSLFKELKDAHSTKFLEILYLDNRKEIEERIKRNDLLAIEGKPNQPDSEIYKDEEYGVRIFCNPENKKL